jgi:hypothetical protein
MSALADPIEALVTWLKADADTAALVGTRVFGGELPTAQNASMPRRCVVIQPAGGGIMGNAYQDYGDFRVDVDCYGETPYEAWRTYLAVAGALKHLNRELSEGVLLHWARASGKGVSGRDPDTDWPITFASFQVLAAEITS